MDLTDTRDRGIAEEGLVTQVLFGNVFVVDEMDLEAISSVVSGESELIAVDLRALFASADAHVDEI